MNINNFKKLCCKFLIDWKKYFVPHLISIKLPSCCNHYTSRCCHSTPVLEATFYLMEANCHWLKWLSISELFVLKLYLHTLVFRSITTNQCVFIEAYLSFKFSFGLQKHSFEIKRHSASYITLFTTLLNNRLRQL